MVYKVAGTNADLAKYPTHIILEILEDNYPVDQDPLPPKAEVTFSLNRFMDNADFQISVLDEMKGDKIKESLGRNALYKFVYKPSVHIWARFNSEDRPTSIDDLKEWVDVTLTSFEGTMPYNVSSISLDPPEELFETDLLSNENEDLAVIDTWNVKIQTYMTVYKWFVD